MIMAKGYVLYNPLAGNGNAGEDAKLLQMVLDEDLEYYDMTRITNYKVFLSNLSTDDYLVIVGGDGTLNRFVNDTDGLEITKEILYFPAGSGNDFARELGTDGNPVVITQYLNNLPSVEVNGRRYRFINGVGFGIDGYCCQVGDELKKTPGKKVNYAAIAIKGLLFHGAGRFRTLCVFPSIFKGEHVKHKNMVAVHTGHEITVEFDRPTPLQIDGETILDVTKYTASAAVCNMNKTKEKVLC